MLVQLLLVSAVVMGLSHTIAKERIFGPVRRAAGDVRTWRGGNGWCASGSSSTRRTTSLRSCNKTADAAEGSARLLRQPGRLRAAQGHRSAALAGYRQDRGT